MPDIEATDVQGAAGDLEALLGDSLIEDAPADGRELKVRRNEEVEAEADGDADESIQAAADKVEETEETEATTAQAEETEETVEEEGDPIETIAQLAEAMETPMEELLASISHEVNGEKVALKDVIENFRDTSIVRAEREAYAQLASQNREHQQMVQAQAAMNAQVMQVLDNQMQGELNDPELAALRNTDPAEWAAKMQDINGRIQQYQQFKQQVGQQYQQDMAQRQDSFMRQQGQILAAEVPGWGQEKLQTALDTIRSIGFQDAEVQQIADARLFKAALELNSLRSEVAQYKQLAEKGKEAAKKVKRTVPKTQKAKAPTSTDGSKKGVQARNVVNLKSRLKKSGTLKDAAALLMAQDVV